MSTPSSTSTTSREKWLMVIAGLLFLAIIIPLLNYLYGSSVSLLLRDRQQLYNEIDQLEMTTRSRAIRLQLKKYEGQSLPPGDDLAPAKYQNWILKIGEDTGIREPSLDRGSPRVFRDVYRSYAFTYRGKGGMKQLVAFLERFRQYDNLHLIRNVTLKPLPKGNELDITITIETLALLKSTNKTFEMRPLDPKQDAKAADSMARTIVDRAFFTAYAPPAPPSPEQPKPTEPAYFDPAPYCYVSVTIEKPGKPEVWIDYRTEGKQRRLTEGESFKVGNIPCVVSKIGFKSVEFAVDFGQEDGWKLLQVEVGRAFAEAELVRDLPDFKPM